MKDNTESSQQTDTAEAGCCLDRRLGFTSGCTPATCMNLPDGQTCGGCAHLGRCVAFGFTSGPDRRVCDFFPRRFCLATVVRGMHAGEGDHG
jgi:hypothetical protein